MGVIELGKTCSGRRVGLAVPRDSRGCTRQYSAKYVNRDSPAYPANNCCAPGDNIRLGNDGLWYKSTPTNRRSSDGNLVCRWVPMSPSYSFTATPRRRPLSKPYIRLNAIVRGRPRTRTRTRSPLRKSPARKNGPRKSPARKNRPTSRSGKPTRWSQVSVPALRRCARVHNVNLHGASRADDIVAHLKAAKVTLSTLSITMV